MNLNLNLGSEDGIESMGWAASTQACTHQLTRINTGYAYHTYPILGLSVDYIPTTRYFRGSYALCIMHESDPEPEVLLHYILPGTYYILPNVCAYADSHLSSLGAFGRYLCYCARWHACPFHRNVCPSCARGSYYGGWSWSALRVDLPLRLDLLQYWRHSSFFHETSIRCC
jgi:hypothetical protein